MCARARDRRGGIRPRSPVRPLGGLRRRFASRPVTLPDVHFVYVLRCADGTLYTGYARDPEQRVKMHNTGHGARYTAGRRPVRLVYSEACETHADALRREHELKRWSRSKKEALLAAYAASQEASLPRER